MSLDPINDDIEKSLSGIGVSDGMRYAMGHTGRSGIKSNTSGLGDAQISFEPDDFSGRAGNKVREGDFDADLDAHGVAAAKRLTVDYLQSSSGDGISYQDMFCSIIMNSIISFHNFFLY